MSRVAAADGASPTPLPPEHVPPSSTVRRAAPPASTNGTALATTTRTRTPRRRVTTAIAAQPSSTLLTSQRPARSRSEKRSRYAAIPPSSTVAVATTNPGVVPTTPQRHHPRVANALSRSDLHAFADQLAAERGSDRPHRPRARPPVGEPQIRAEKPIGSPGRPVQPDRRHRPPHGRRQPPFRSEAARGARRGDCRPTGVAARTGLERERRERRREAKHRDRGHDHAARERREALECGNQPCGHDTRVGMGPRRPRPAAGNSGRPRAAALARSRHAP